MGEARKRSVGRFKVEVELANKDDLSAVRRGNLTADKVRRVKIAGVVDSGASLPTSIGKQLGLPVTGKVEVTYPERSSTRRDQVEGVYLELLGRHDVFKANLEQNRDTALTGALVIEELDFWIDPLKERLYPRNPKMITSETG
jgi:hypothetical protein